MESDVIPLNYLMALVVGWLLAKNKYSDLVAQEKDNHLTLAVQTLYLNGKGKISNQDLEVHDRVAKEVKELANANPSWLHSQIRKEILDE